MLISCGAPKQVTRPAPRTEERLPDCACRTAWARANYGVAFAALLTLTAGCSTTQSLARRPALPQSAAGHANRHGIGTATALHDERTSPELAAHPPEWLVTRFQSGDTFSSLPSTGDVQFASDLRPFDELNPAAANSVDPWFMMRTDDLMRLPPIDPEQRDPEQRTFAELVTDQFAGVVSDHALFYSGEGLTWMAAGFAAGAVMANTDFDSHFVRHHYLQNVVNISNDEFYETIHQPHFLGDGRYTIPVFALAALSEPLIDQWPYGPATAEWGQRSLRTVLVGAPAMLAAQLLTGGSRPDETTANSRWKPLQDSNGVSGHSFMGAVPFLSAAKTTENGWLKAGLYVLSTAPAISRVNDDKHYFSQAFLGWWLAYSAAYAVDRSHNVAENAQWIVTPVGDGLGLGMTYRH